MNHKQLAEHAVMLFTRYPEAKHEGEALVMHHGGPASWLNPPETVMYPDGSTYTNDQLEGICRCWLALKAYDKLRGSAGTTAKGSVVIHEVA